MGEDAMRYYNGTELPSVAEMQNGGGPNFDEDVQNALGTFLLERIFTIGSNLPPNNPYSIVVSAGFATVADDLLDATRRDLTVEVDPVANAISTDGGNTWLSIVDTSGEFLVNVAAAGIAAGLVTFAPAGALTVAMTVAAPIGVGAAASFAWSFLTNKRDADLAIWIEGLYNTRPGDLRLYIDGEPQREGMIYDEGEGPSATSSGLIENLLRASDTVFDIAEVRFADIGATNKGDLIGVVQSASPLWQIAERTGMSEDAFLALSQQGGPQNGFNVVRRDFANDLYYLIGDGGEDVIPKTLTVRRFDENGTVLHDISAVYRQDATGTPSLVLGAPTQNPSESTSLIIGTEDATALSADVNSKSVLLGEDRPMQLFGAGFDDHIYGGTADDVIAASFGSDFISGGLGHDRMNYATIGSGGVTVAVSDLIDVTLANGDKDVLSNIEFIETGGGNDIIHHIGKDPLSYFVSNQSATDYYEIDAGEGYDTVKVIWQAGFDLSYFINENGHLTHEDGMLVSNIEEIDVDFTNGFFGTISFTDFDFNNLILRSTTGADSVGRLNFDFSQLNQRMIFNTLGGLVESGSKFVQLTSQEGYFTVGQNNTIIGTNFGDIYNISESYDESHKYDVFITGSGDDIINAIPNHYFTYAGSTNDTFLYGGGNDIVRGGFMSVEFGHGFDVDAVSISKIATRVLESTDGAPIVWESDFLLDVSGSGQIKFENIVSGYSNVTGYREVQNLQLSADQTDGTKIVRDIAIQDDFYEQFFRNGGVLFREILQNSNTSNGFLGTISRDVIYASVTASSSFKLLAGADEISADHRNLSIDLGHGADIYRDGSGTATVIGSFGNDTFLNHVGGDDLVHGGAGNDLYSWTKTGPSIGTLRFYGDGGQDTLQIKLTAAEATDEMLLDFAYNANFLRQFTETNLGADNFISFDALGISAWDIETLELWIDGVEVVPLNSRSGTGAREIIIVPDGTGPIDAGGGDDVVFGTSSADEIIGGGGNNRLVGYEGNDTLLGGNDDDGLYGGNGNDILNGGLGVNTVSGWRGNDLLIDGGGQDDYQGGDGYDTVDYGFANGGAIILMTNPSGNAGAATGDTFSSIERIIGTGFDDVIRAAEGTTLLDGGDGDDSLTGTLRRDRLFGGDDRDVLRGLDMDDKLYGQGGDDYLSGGAGDDLLDGGEGSDTAYYAFALGGMTLSLADETKNTFEAKGDAYLSIENLFGTRYSDTLEGNAFANRLVGWDGDDHLYGGYGSDRLDGRNGSDRLFGENGDDTLLGGVGDDVLLGGLGADRLFGGSGIDRAQYSDATALVVADLQDISLNVGKFAVGDSYSQIENLQGSAFSDQLRGNGADNLLIGVAGNDFLTGRNGDDNLLGGDGDDVLTGGNGADRLSGGAGIDRANYIDAVSGVKVDLQYAQFNGGIATGDTFFGIENLRGSRGRDDLRGDEFNNKIEGFEGNDTLNGRDGNDELRGGTGQDILKGGAGQDVLIGSLGADIFHFETPDDGVDTIVDFKPGQDLIRLDDAGFGSLSRGILSASNFRLAGVTPDSDDYILLSNKSLYYDPDGSGSAPLVRFAILGNGVSVDADDFIVM